MKLLTQTLSILALSSTALITTNAMAQDSDIDLSAHVDFVSDYRLRGVSLTNKRPTVQGGFEVASGGFSVGAWASGLDKDFAGADTEMDVYAGYSFALADGISLDVGGTLYTYTGASDFDFAEGFATLGFATGDISWALSTYYAPSQKNMADQDNVWVTLGGEYPIKDTPISLNASIGYESGFFADSLAGGTKWDYSVGAAYSFKQFSISAAVIGTDNSDQRETKTGFMIALGASF